MVYGEAVQELSVIASILGPESPNAMSLILLSPTSSATVSTGLTLDD